MTFKDIFKSSFIENFSSISIFDMVLVLFLAFLIGLYILLIYKKCYSGIMYSQSFGITLMALVLITSMLIMTIVSNVVLSLGMVGALSIVRFRTAIKEPLDIVFLFWAIAVGIILASGLIPLAVFGSFIIGLVLLLFNNHKDHSMPYILVLNLDTNDDEEAIMHYLNAKVDKLLVKSKSITDNNLELNLEIRLKNNDTSFIDALHKEYHLNNVVLVSYNGDYMG